MLRDVQAGLRAAILDDVACDAANDGIIGDGLAPAARVAIYRHHVFATLTDALAAVYPAVCRLVDRRFFAYAADRYIREHPPAGPCLFEYGASFAAFLAAFPPCASLAYLPDVARLEWAMNVALHAPDVEAAGAAALAGLPADAVAGLTFRLHPSVTLLASPWPVDDVWRAGQAHTADDIVDLDAGGVRLQVWRLDDDVVFRRLPAAAAALRDTLATGRPLAAAATAALAADPTADLPSLIRALLDERILAPPS